MKVKIEASYKGTLEIDEQDLKGMTTKETDVYITECVDDHVRANVSTDWIKI